MSKWVVLILMLFASAWSDTTLTVGKSTKYDFTTINKALESAQVLVASQSVIVKIYPGTYSEMVELKASTKLGKGRRITLEGVHVDSVAISFRDTNTVSIRGEGYRLRNLTFTTSDSQKSNLLVCMYNSAKDIQFEQCDFVALFKKSVVDYGAVNVLFRRCRFLNKQYGSEVRGGLFRFTNCTFTGDFPVTNYAMPLLAFYGGSNQQVDSCIFRNPDGAGLLASFYDWDKGFSAHHNHFLVDGYYSLNLYSAISSRIEANSFAGSASIHLNIGSAAYTSKVYNNTFAGGSKLILANHGHGTEFVFNTLFTNTKGVGLISNSYSDFICYNNIGITTGLIYDVSKLPDYSSYNIWYSTTPKPFFYGSAFYDFNGWCATNKRDLQSAFSKVVFTDSTNLRIAESHPDNKIAWRTGRAGSGIPEDIDGDRRNNPPCIGADEFVHSPAKILIKVTDARDQKPISMASVIINGWPGTKSTSSTGTCEIPVLPGTYSLTVQRERFATFSASGIKAVANGTTTIDAILKFPVIQVSGSNDWKKIPVAPNHNLRKYITVKNSADAAWGSNLRFEMQISSGGQDFSKKSHETVQTTDFFLPKGVSDPRGITCYNGVVLILTDVLDSSGWYQRPALLTYTVKGGFLRKVWLDEQCSGLDVFLDTVYTLTAGNILRKLDVDNGVFYKDSLVLDFKGTTSLFAFDTSRKEVIFGNSISPLYTLNLKQRKAKAVRAGISHSNLAGIAYERTIDSVARVWLSYKIASSYGPLITLASYDLSASKLNPTITPRGDVKEYASDLAIQKRVAPLGFYSLQPANNGTHAVRYYVLANASTLELYDSLTDKRVLSGNELVLGPGKSQSFWLALDSSLYDQLPDSGSDFKLSIYNNGSGFTDTSPIEIPMLLFKGLPVGQKELGLIPLQRSISQPWPNPFNPVVTISIRSRQPEMLRFRVFNQIGQQLWETSSTTHAGMNWFSWEGISSSGQTMPSGLYYLRISGKGFHAVKSAVLLK